MTLMKTKELVSKIGQVTVKLSSKKHLCGIKTKLNAVLYKSCGNWIHGRCAKMKRVTNRPTIDCKSRKSKGYNNVT